MSIEKKKIMEYEGILRAIKELQYIPCPFGVFCIYIQSFVFQYLDWAFKIGREEKR